MSNPAIAALALYLLGGAIFAQVAQHSKNKVMRFTVYAALVVLWIPFIGSNLIGYMIGGRR